MIIFEPNGNTMTLTNEQARTMLGIVNGDWVLDYDVVEHNDETPHIALWVHHPEGNPTRHGILPDGTIALSEEVTWDWKGTS